MSDLSPLGCAVRSDGSLKDAAEIEWSFDKDDETPMTSLRPPPAQSVHPFFAGHVSAPAAFVAGSRRSNRSTRPSARVIDPNNVMNNPSPSTKTHPSRSVGEKRKAPNLKPARSVLRKVAAGSDSERETDGDDDTSHPTKVGSETGNTEDVQDEFKTLQAMADNDHRV